VDALQRPFTETEIRALRKGVERYGDNYVRMHNRINQLKSRPPSVLRMKWEDLQDEEEELKLANNRKRKSPFELSENESRYNNGASAGTRSTPVNQTASASGQTHNSSNTKRTRTQSALAASSQDIDDDFSTYFNM
jgi:hypothetical protein